MERSTRLVAARRGVLLLLVIVSFAGFTQSSEPVYFPKQTFSSNDSAADSKASHYAARLRGLREPSLLALTDFTVSHSFRFLWLRTFDNPIALRLSILDYSGIGQLTIKVADGAGGYETGNLVINKSLPVSAPEVQGFLKLVDQAKFWKLATVEEIVRPDGVVVVTGDGADWVVEAVQGRRYHVVDRHSPTEGAYREMALELLRLSGLKVEKIY